MALLRFLLTAVVALAAAAPAQAHVSADPQDAKAGAYQVRNVRNAMMLNFGGSATTNYAFVVGRE